ncbi:hypothetical protein [Mycobacterium conspicuum]|uniref:hypothetical protein n=1 Tax=Mycobacterium conspicuum TaxID=44010 RepID=UPI000A15E5D7|nr:hypothetical protein [Mycobacterium conspicuum]ORV38740.1 hypothetical protein AWC00_00445 [Mycobacterium conspicuum]
MSVLRERASCSSLTEAVDCMLALRRTQRFKALHPFSGPDALAARLLTYAQLVQKCTTYTAAEKRLAEAVTELMCDPLNEELLDKVRDARDAV